MSRERHRGHGVRRGWARVRDQADRARPTSRSSRPTDRARGAGRRRVHAPTSRRPRRCRSAATHLADGRAAAVVLSSGNANAATGRAGPRRRAPHVRADRRRASAVDGRRRARVLDRAHRHPDADGARSSPASRSSARGAQRRRRAAAEAMLTTDTVRKEAVAAVAGTRRSSAAWPRARRCSRPRWRRCSRSSPPTPRSTRRRCSARCARAVDATRSTACCVDGCDRARTTPCSCSPTARPACDAIEHAGRVHRRAHRGVRLARRADGARRRRRDEVRPGHACVGARVRRRRPRRGPRGRQQSSSCSARSTATTRTGAGCSRSSARAARTFDPEQVDIAYNGVIVCRDGIACAARRGRARARRWPAARSRSSATCTPAHGEATMLITDLSHAYIDENRRTS